MDPEKERKPPAQPTPLDFPVYRLPVVVPHPANSTLPDLQGSLASIKRPQDISLERFSPLNLKVDHDVEIHDMFPQDQARSLPHLPWESPPETAAGDDQTRPLMNNGLPYPPKERYEVLESELLLENDDVFREVSRLPSREGRDRVRVTQTRKFWAALERMGQYWDTSLDSYYERPVTPQPTPPSEGENKEDQMQVDNQPDAAESKMDVDQPEIAAKTDSSATNTDSPGPTVTMYKGRRSGANHEMPDDTRDETVRAFVEMAAWPFGCQVTAPTLPPRLTVKSLLFPVRQSFQAARSPRDRQVARNGILEGPVLVGQCRPEIGFRSEGDTPGTGLGEVCDLFREVGGMLLAAQERAREGAVETRPGEGKWWTTAPRFGGAPHDEILDDLMKGPGIHGIPIPQSMLGTDEDSASPAAPEAESSRKRHKFEHPYITSLGRRPSAMRKLSSAEKWKILQPGPSLWDKRMRYMQIGKAKESPFDDV